MAWEGLDLYAKLLAAELPVYAIVLFILIKELGIVGASLAWCMRVGIDGAVLLVLSKRLLPELNIKVLRYGAISMLIIAVLISCLFLQALWTKLLIGVVIMITFALVSWLILLEKLKRK